MKLKNTLVSIMAAAMPVFYQGNVSAGDGTADSRLEEAFELLGSIGMDNKYSYLGPVSEINAQERWLEGKHEPYKEFVHSNFFFRLSHDKKVEFYRNAVDLLMDSENLCRCQHDESIPDEQKCYTFETYGEDMLLRLRSIARAQGRGFVQEALNQPKYLEFLEASMEKEGSCRRDSKMIWNVYHGIHEKEEWEVELEKTLDNFGI